MNETDNRNEKFRNILKTLFKLVFWKHFLNLLHIL